MRQIRIRDHRTLYKIERLQACQVTKMRQTHGRELLVALHIEFVQLRHAAKIRQRRQSSAPAAKEPMPCSGRRIDDILSVTLI